jgi:hypothetical protein
MDTQVWNVAQGWLTATARGLTLAFGGPEQPHFEPLAAGAGFNTRRLQKDRTTLLHRTCFISDRTENKVRATAIRLRMDDFVLTQTPQNTALLNASRKPTGPE